MDLLPEKELNFYNNINQKRRVNMNKNTVANILCILGLYIVIDGLVSIIWYVDQPVFPDHALRFVRILIGIFIFIGSYNLKRR